MAKRAALAAVAALLISPLGAGYVSAADDYVTVKDTNNTNQTVYTKDGVDVQLSEYAKNTTVSKNTSDISDLEAKTEGITDGTTKDGQYVNTDNYVGQNLYALDQDLQAETSARMAADTTLQTNIDNEAAERKVADTVLDDKITSETLARVAADTKLVEAVNSGLSLNDDNVLQKNTTTIDAKAT